MSKVKNVDTYVEITLVYTVEPVVVETSWWKYSVDQVKVTYDTPDPQDEPYDVEPYSIDLYGWRVNTNGSIDKRQKERERCALGTTRETVAFIRDEFGIDFEADLAARYTHIAKERV